MSRAAARPDSGQVSAVMATELMSGEDLALLPGPDRIEIHHVTGYHMPRPLPRAAPRGQHERTPT
jgi:hypothetical protein